MQVNQIIATKLSTSNDVNGCPRRLYIVHEIVIGNRNANQRLAVIEEEYDGVQALLNAYPSAIVMQEVEVTPKVYKQWVRVGENDRKARSV